MCDYIVLCVLKFLVLLSVLVYIYPEHLVGQLVA